VRVAELKRQVRGLADRFLPARERIADLSRDVGELRDIALNSESIEGCGRRARERISQAQVEIAELNFAEMHETAARLMQCIRDKVQDVDGAREAALAADDTVRAQSLSVAAEEVYDLDKTVINLHHEIDAFQRQQKRYLGALSESAELCAPSEF